MPATKPKKKKKKGNKLIKGVKSRLNKARIADFLTILPSPYGFEKMSDVLVRFVEPYALCAKTEEDYRAVYSVASVAWNASLLPREEVDDLILRHIPPEEDEVRLLINELVRRKRRYFADYSRFILDHEVKMLGSRVYVNVTSTLAQVRDPQ